MTTKVTIENPSGNDRECITIINDGYLDGRMQLTTLVIPPGQKADISVYPPREVHIHEQFINPPQQEKK